jgi:polar amino acid transport system substrate-binding protein
MTGYNRRFSKPFKEIQKFFSEIKEPFVINYRINAGYIPKTHWTQDPSQGGRIIGEVCHFIDTISFIINSNPIGVYAQSIESQNNLIQNYDSVSIVIKYENGSVGNILYLSNGDSSVFKEYCEIFAGNKTAIMDNYKQVSYYSNGKNKNVKYDGKKGHKQEVEHFVKLILGKDKINLTFESIYLTTLTTFRILESLQSNKFVTI